MASVHDRAVTAAAAVLGLDPATVEVRVRGRGKGGGRPRVTTDDAIRAAVAAAPSFAAAARALGVSSRTVRNAAMRLGCAPVSVGGKKTDAREDK